MFIHKHISKEKNRSKMCKFFLLRLYTPLCRSVGPSVLPSVRPSVRPFVRHTLLFWRLWGFWPSCSCPNAPRTSIMASAHLHATRLAVYPALFRIIFLNVFVSNLKVIINYINNVSFLLKDWKRIINY